MSRPDPADPLRWDRISEGTTSAELSHSEVESPRPQVRPRASEIVGEGADQQRHQPSRSAPGIGGHLPEAQRGGCCDPSSAVPAPRGRPHQSSPIAATRKLPGLSRGAIGSWTDPPMCRTPVPPSGVRSPEPILSIRCTSGLR